MHVIPADYFKKIDNFKLADSALALEQLAVPLNGIVLYNAGSPNYPYNFTRDSLLSAILMEDTVMLRNQLVYCSLLQGEYPDSLTGEEPGKIFHQMPGAIQRGLSTEYNACDTTAIFIHAHKIYLDLTQDFEFIDRQRKYLLRAVDYILRHLVNYLFVEDPKFSNASRFGLKLTYWKDSQVTNREEGYPSYPAVFTLAHVQNMRALFSASILLNSSDLYDTATQMKRHLTILFDERRGIFYSGVDQKGFFPGTSSDNLHMLYYLDKNDLSQEKILKMINNTRKLETDYGFMTLDTKDEWLLNDITRHTGYHTNTIWPFEQAFIHMGARKFGLPSVMKISERIYPHIDNSYPELFISIDKSFEKKGSDIQLWTIAAKIYFEKYFNRILTF